MKTQSKNSDGKGPAAGAAPAGFAERFAEVNGVRLHYLIGGKGSPVVLLHGYAQTGHMWFPIMPLLAKRHTVIVPDLRGAGGSGKPESGYDKKNMAVDIHELTSSLGFDPGNHRICPLIHDDAELKMRFLEGICCRDQVQSRQLTLQRFSEKLELS